MSVRVCRPKLFKNLRLSLVSGVLPLLFFRTTPLAAAVRCDDGHGAESTPMRALVRSILIAAGTAVRTSVPRNVFNYRRRLFAGRRVSVKGTRTELNRTLSVCTAACVDD